MSAVIGGDGGCIARIVRALPVHDNRDGERQGARADGVDPVKAGQSSKEYSSRSLLRKAGIERNSFRKRRQGKRRLLVWIDTP